MWGWDHQCCTLFIALVHYKDANDFLQHEPFFLVSDYMNHDKYAVLVFLERIFDKFKNLYPDIIITKKYLRSDGAGQYLNKSTQSVEWLWWKKKLSGILVPHHMEKVTVMDLGGTWKLYIREKTRARVIDLQTCLELCFRNLSQYQYYPLPNWNYWKCKARSW